MEKLKEGKAIRRKNWDKNVFVYPHNEDYLTGNELHYVWNKKFKNCEGELFTSDFLAEDWETKD